MVEGTSLLRKHTGLNLYRGFESLALRQKETRQGRRMFGGWDENPRRYKSGFDQQAKLMQDVEDGLER